MSWIQILIWLNGAMFVGYGVACLVSPALPAGYAGFELATTSGTVEIVAMYGGLQVGFGVLLLLGALKPEMRDTALWAMAVVLGSLCLARVFGLVFHGASAYNLAAAAYEGTVATLSILALRTGAAREVTP